MKNVLFLTANYGNQTGGTKYDKFFIQELSKQKELSIKVMQDSDFKIENTHWKSFTKLYRNHLNNFQQYDYFITNSRLYTRLFRIISKIKKTGTKVICFHHHYNFMTHNGWKKMIHKTLELFFLNKCDEIIHASPYVYNLSQNFLKTNKLRLFTLAAIKKEKHNISKLDNKQLMFLGNVETRKGLHYLLQSLAILKHNKCVFNLKIAGDSHYDEDYSNSLKQFIDEHQLLDCITFCGRVDNEEKEKLFLESSVFVFPSMHEGYGYVLLEAMDYGLPVIAFDNSAMPITVRNNYNGCLIVDKDVKAFADAIEKLLLDENLKHKLAAGAIETAKNAMTEEKLQAHIANYALELV